MLSNLELENILKAGESDRVEFTESTNDLDKIRQATCAFANDLPAYGEPGFIFVGVKDDMSCAGLTISDELLQKFGGLRNDGKLLPFPVIEVGKQTLNGCEVAVIQVEPSDNPPVKVDGRCWIRVGPRRAQATAEEERKLTEKRRWGNLSFDLQGVKGASVEKDLDLWKFEQEYLPCAVSPEALEENDRDLSEQLQALRLAAQNGTPSVTAILISGKDPHYWFPGAYIQFVRYEGSEVTDPVADHKEIRGTLPEQLLDLDRILKANISNPLDTSGEIHRESADYPYAALRELARNAVIHRNYENSNTPVRIHWFTDNIVIVSPGSVYGAVTRKNFGQPGITAYRNPTIAEAMKNLGFMQRFGIGITTANKALKDNNNPPVEFDIQENFVTATVKKQL